MGPGEEAALLQALKRTGREMRAEGAHDIDRAPLNRFFSSDTGRSFVHELDRQHAEAVTRTDAVTGNRDSALERLQRTPLYRDASEQDQASLGALFMKLENQSGRAYTPRLLTRIEDGSLASTTTVKSAIDALIPDSANGNPDYIQSGADNTLRGVRVFNALRTAAPDSPLREAWTSVIADPLMGPVVAHAGHDRDGRLGAQYDTVRSLFLTPEASLRMIDALDRGATLAQGDPALRQGRRAAGFYVSGQDFVHWNASGDGAAYVEGRWRGIDADQLQRIVHRDGTTELRITEDGRSETLLHVDLPTRTNDGRRADHRPELPKEGLNKWL